MNNEKDTKIVEIICETNDACYKAVINKGKTNSVKLGDKYLIVGLGKEIIDPDTKENLGRLEIVRGIAKVTHVQEKMATIESVNYKKQTPEKTVEESSNNLHFALGLGGKIKKTTYKEQEQQLLPFEEIQLGDLAKKIEE